jgi:scyllo-inositol 2-dehydrogenase (NADP+)
MTKSSNKADKRVVRVALVGYGLAGSVFHAPLIECTDNMQLTAIVTRDPARQAAARLAFPEADIIDDVETLWARAAEFDLAVIAAPNRFHAPLAIAALNAGLHVVVDKPMALTSHECEQMVTTSRAQQKLLSVFQNRRWDADFLTISLLVRSNNLGPITRLESRFERWRPISKGTWRESGTVDEGAGLLFDLGSHLVDQALTLFGKPQFVYAELDTRRANVGADDDCFIALTFPGGVRAHLWTSAVARRPGPRFRLCGLLGTFEKEGLDPQEDALRAGRRPTASMTWGAEPSEFWGSIHAERDGLNYEGRVETLHGDYPAYYKQMRDAIIDGAPVPVDPADAVLTARVIEAARRSAELHEIVSLESVPVS